MRPNSFHWRYTAYGSFGVSGLSHGTTNPFSLKVPVRIELTTSWLTANRSTTELQNQKFDELAGFEPAHPRLSPGALPLSLQPQVNRHHLPMNSTYLTYLLLDQKWQLMKLAFRIKMGAQGIEPCFQPLHQHAPTGIRTQTVHLKRMLYYHYTIEANKLSMIFSFSDLVSF